MVTPPDESSVKKTADNVEPFERTLPLRLTSIVVRGYGRGSNDLGIPTANLSREKIKFNLVNASFDDLPAGMYSAEHVFRVQSATNVIDFKLSNALA